MIKKYNVTIPQKYLSGGVEKTYWANCGTMTEFIKEDGSISRILEIPAIGMKANIFPIEPKTPPANYQSVPPQTATDTYAPVQTEPVIEYPTAEINPDDIPF